MNGQHTRRHGWTSDYRQRCVLTSAKILKSLVPSDAKKCFGYDVQITRDRAGRLSLRELQE